MQMTKGVDKTKLKREWSKEAIDLALKGEWQRATEVNQALLALYPEEVDAKNRLGKAFMELGEYEQARDVLTDVVSRAPHNTIAQKNLARLQQLASSPAATRQARKSNSVTKLFIAESGKSVTTTLKQPAATRTLASVAPGDPVTLVVRNQSIWVYVRDEEYLGQLEPRMASRLAKLINGGNRYEAAVVGVNDWGISVFLREVYRHPSLHSIQSFPNSARAENGPVHGRNLAGFLEAEDLDEEEEDAIEFVQMPDLGGEWDE